MASLIRVLGDFDVAEEAVQDAFAVALERWPVHGIPDNPGAWITTTARNKAIDRLRRDRTLRREAGPSCSGRPARGAPAEAASGRPAPSPTTGCG